MFCTNFITGKYPDKLHNFFLIIIKVHCRGQVVNSASKDSKCNLYLNWKKIQLKEVVICGRSHNKLMPEPIRHLSQVVFSVQEHSWPTGYFHSYSSFHTELSNLFLIIIVSYKLLLLHSRYSCIYFKWINKALLNEPHKPFSKIHCLKKLFMKRLKLWDQRFLNWSTFIQSF